MHTAECERGVSALTRIHTDFRNRLSQATVEQLLYAKLNGPTPAEFDFDFALNLWLHEARRKLQIAKVPLL